MLFQNLVLHVIEKISFMEELCTKNGIFDNKNQKVENHDVVDI